MIRACGDADVAAILAVINAAAEAYRGVIPADCWPADNWRGPYMPEHELIGELAAGVAFLGWDEDGNLVGVMGLQPVEDVALIRHAYVAPGRQRRDIGGRLLAALLDGVDRPILVGTWAAARWAVAFYQKHGFALAGGAEKERLLRRYWTVPDRQIETSVVLRKG